MKQSQGIAGYGVRSAALEQLMRNASVKGDETAAADSPAGILEAPASLRGVRGPLPIVVGITGHRDIRPADIEPLSKRVGDIFEELASTYKHTPILLLSPLAPGADRIAARAAMRLSIPVIAPLPLERPEYEKDFDEVERAEFTNLLASAHCDFFVGYAPGNDADAVANNRNARDRQYAKVGSYIARNSQILIALWNGLPSKAIGGTAQIVKFKREGVPEGFGPLWRPLDPPENGPVRQIITPRSRKDPEQVLGGEPLQSIHLPPIFAVDTGLREEASPSEVSAATYRRMDRFNRDAVCIGAAGDRLSTVTLRSAADQLATRFRNKTLSTLGLLFVFTFSAATAFAIYAHIVKLHPVALSSYLALSLVVIVIYCMARKLEYQNCYQDYRAIAEGLRIQDFWQRANISETVADHYLRQYRGELDWIRNAIRVCRVLDQAARSDDRLDLTTRVQRLTEACREWIGDAQHGQLAFFYDRIRLQERRAMQCETFAAAFIAGSLLLALFALFCKCARPIEEWLVLGIALTAVGSGLVQGYAHIRAYREQAKQYRRMYGFFRRAKAKVTGLLARDPFQEQDYCDVQRVLRDLGEEALTENAAWVILHRERPVEFPHGS